MRNCMAEQEFMAQEIELYKRASRGDTFIDGVLTTIAWVGFISLIMIGLYNIWEAETAPGAEHVELYGHVMLYSLYTVLAYLCVALLLLGMLVAWSAYNTWRWRGKERRSRFPNLNVAKVPSYFGANPAVVVQLRNAAIVTIHSDQNGDIRFLTHDELGEGHPETVLPNVSS